MRTALSAPAVKTVLPSGENVEQSTGELFSWFTDLREAQVKGESS
jgi:hypothetical protein